MKVFTEFLGTFFFLFTISLAAPLAGDLAPLAIGGALMTMVYMGAHRSGAHYNPAVSLGLLLSRKMEARDFLPYLIAQIAGGIAAFALGWAITGRTVALVPGPSYSPGQAFLVETIFTFMLVLVVLNVAATRATEGKGFYGLAIGFTIVVAAFAGGSVSGGAFNPAVAIGATTLYATQGGGSWSSLWIVTLGPLAGGVLGAGTFALMERGSSRNGAN